MVIPRLTEREERKENVLKIVQSDAPIKGSSVLKVATFSGSHKPQDNANEPV